jgi:threonine/homoserine/homoserine lactone efflux protein
MSADIWGAFAVFAFVAAATPGPNNLLILGSGLRVGMWRTVPFIAGVSVGFSGLLLAVGYGLGQAFERFPAAQTALKVLGTGYFLFLAWTLVRSGRGKAKADGAELGFRAGALFQAVNPKAWIMCITAISLFLAPGWSFATLALMVLTFVAVGVPANLAWAGMGQVLRPLVERADRMRVFNRVMAVLLVLSILPVWMPGQ